MKDLIKAIEELPVIVKFILTLFWGVLTNIYRLARSIVKENTLGIVLSIILLICGGFVILWILDLVYIVLGKEIWWID